MTSMGWASTPTSPSAVPTMTTIKSRWPWKPRNPWCVSRWGARASTRVAVRAPILTAFWWFMRDRSVLYGRQKGILHPGIEDGGGFRRRPGGVAPLPARGASGGAHADRPAARVLRVIDRAHDTVVGRYEVAEPFGVVVPEDHNIPYDIFTMRADSPDIPDRALVRVRMTAYPSRHEAACGVIEEVLGMADEATVSVESIISSRQA